MNNRLNKLTDSLGEQLNYCSRRPGKQAKHKKYRGSPLIDNRAVPPVLLTSRTSRSPRISSYHHSVSFTEGSSEDSKEILIVEEEEEKAEILIVED